MIVIFGATGKIGGAAARALRARGLQVKAVVREATKAQALRALGCEIALADLNDEGATAEAVAGAEATLVICPLQPSAADVSAEAQRIIDTLGAALTKARPQHIVAISDYGAQVPSGTGVTLILRRLEARLRSVPARVTFVRSAEHMQNWLRMLGLARSQGVLPSLHHPVERAFPTVSAYDVGALAAELLAAPSELAGAPRVIHAEGPHRYSAADVAAVYAQALERTVSAQALPRERWHDTLAGRLGESYARLVCELQDAHNSGQIEVEPGGEVWRGTTELASALKDGIALELARDPKRAQT
jgi:NAD(P)H dehydrogenase (quinone)